jgi:hypothetical protein
VDSGIPAFSKDWYVGILKVSLSQLVDNHFRRNFSQPFNLQISERGITLKRKYSLAIASTMMLIASTSLQAAPIAGSSPGIFVNPTGPVGMVTSGEGTSDFVWGTGLGSPPSYMSYTGYTFYTQTDQVFSLGSLLYFNGTTILGSEATTVDLNLTALFTTPSGITGSLLTNFGIITTPNTSDPYASMDLIQIQTFPSTTFASGGISYALEFLGFGYSGNAPGPVEPFPLYQNQYHVMEGFGSNVELLARVTEIVSPVPELETYAMLLAGLGLFGFQLRRRKGTQDSASMLGMA